MRSARIRWWCSRTHRSRRFARAGTSGSMSRAGADAARAIRHGGSDLWPRTPDPAQPERQHQLPFRDGDRLAMAVPVHLHPGRDLAAQADRGDEPRRTVLLARCHWLAIHQYYRWERRHELCAARQHQPRGGLRHPGRQAGRYLMPGRGEPDTATDPFLCLGRLI